MNERNNYLLTDEEDPHYLGSGIEGEKWVPDPPLNEPDPLKPRTVYYYIRDNQKRPVVTVCLIHLELEYARGVSICSPVLRPSRRDPHCLTFKESPRIVRGRGLAFQRAQKAWLSKSTSEEIRRDFIRQYLYALATRNDGPALPSYKSEYMPLLTYFEQRLLYGEKGPLT